MKIFNIFIIISVLVCFSSAAMLSAQSSQSDEYSEASYYAFKYALGMFGTTAAGNGTGGLHFQRWFDRFGFQITTGGVYHPDEDYSSTLDYSFVLDGLWSVYGSTFSNWLSGRLYFWISAGHRGFIPNADAERRVYTEPSGRIWNRD